MPSPESRCAGKAVIDKMITEDMRNDALLGGLRDRLNNDPFWSTYLSDTDFSSTPFRSLHVAVFREPFLTLVLSGQKSLESRFAVNQVPPYREVMAGDVILLKRVAGPVVGIARAEAVWDYDLDPSTLSQLRSEFADMLCAQDPEFWKIKESARFATLIALDQVRSLPNLPYPKHDRRGWVVEISRVTQLSLDL